MRKVLISNRVYEVGLEALYPTCRVVMPPEGQKAFTREELLRELPDADALLACGRVDEEMLAAAPRLKIISNHGAGYELVDVAAATRRGIPVTNIPDQTAIPTAEMALMLLLAVERDLLRLNRMLREGKPEDCFGIGVLMGHSLEGQTLGVVGLGHIGLKMAELCHALGMKVVYHNRRPRNDVPYEWMPLDDLMKTCDVLTLHCPLHESTKNLISRERLALMKKGAMVINTARGGVMDYDALEDALRRGDLGGAGLDVYPDEPHIPTGLLKLEHVVLMPHYGTNTHEARLDMVRACSQRILDALDGKRPQNVVNPEIYAMEEENDRN